MNGKRQTTVWAGQLLLALGLAVLTLAIPAGAQAALYRYQTPDGKILITTEKQPGYKLLEVLSDGAPKSTAMPAKPQVPKHREQSASSAPAPGASHTKRKSTRKGENGFDDIIAEASEAYDVPFAFIKAVIRIESAFRPDAESHAGAMGLMQLMPRTAASLNVTDAYNPRQNIYGGAKFLRILIDRYDGDINLILAAYNAGDVAVKRYGGIPYPQTRDYVASIYHWYKVYEKQQEPR